MLRRLLVITLITLAVSPVTAPFATYDFAAVNPTHADSQFLTSAKVLQDASAIAYFAERSVLLERVEQLSTPLPPSVEHVGRFCPLVLRL